MMRDVGGVQMPDYFGKVVGEDEKKPEAATPSAEKPGEPQEPKPK